LSFHGFMYISVLVHCELIESSLKRKKKEKAKGTKKM